MKFAQIIIIVALSLGGIFAHAKAACGASKAPAQDVNREKDVTKVAALSTPVVAPVSQPKVPAARR